MKECNVEGALSTKLLQFDSQYTAADFDFVFGFAGWKGDNVREVEEILTKECRDKKVPVRCLFVWAKVYINMKAMLTFE